MQHDLHEGREQTKDEGMDTYDLASDARDREINLILTDRDRDKLQAIDEALARVDDGTYGVCESCERDIAEARLEALPFTRLCVNCQAEREKEAKTHEALRGGPHLPAPRRRATRDEESGLRPSAARQTEAQADAAGRAARPAISQSAPSAEQRPSGRRGAWRRSRARARAPRTIRYAA